MITFHHNFFPDVNFINSLKKDVDDCPKLSNSFIQILLSQALVRYVEASNLIERYSLSSIITAIKLYFQEHLNDCGKKIILYRNYTTETVDIMNDNVIGGMIPVPKGLYEMWNERRLNHAELNGEILDRDKDLTIMELFDRKSFCLYYNQDVYDNCFVYIDIPYLLKLIKIN